MKTHQLQLRVPADRVVTVKLPDDCPAGEPDVLLVANPMTQRTIRPPAIALGPIVFHEDPTAPLHESGWPEAHS